MPDEIIGVPEAQAALKSILIVEAQAVRQAQEMMAEVNAKREKAMQDLRQAIAAEPQNSKPGGGPGAVEIVGHGQPMRDAR